LEVLKKSLERMRLLEKTEAVFLRNVDFVLKTVALLIISPIIVVHYRFLWINYFFYLPSTTKIGFNALDFRSPARLKHLIL